MTNLQTRSWAFPKGTNTEVTYEGPVLKISFQDGDFKHTISVGESSASDSDVKSVLPPFLVKKEKTSLTEEKVAEIKALHPVLRDRSKCSIRDANFVLAAQYNCSDKNIDAIMRGRTWPAVKPAKNLPEILSKVSFSERLTIV